jgi:hypothetical protein
MCFSGERVAPQIQAAQGPLRDADIVEPRHMTDPEKSKKGLSSVSTTTVRGMLTSRHRQAEGCSEEARRERRRDFADFGD